jgi:RNA polymerase sigma factor (TIGR02999 family)
MAPSSSEQVTALLQRWKLNGDPEAEQELFALVDHELRRIAQGMLRRESGFDHKIDPRELVSEAYLTLREYPIVTVNRAPFFRLMAKSMRNHLMDLAKHDRAAKRPPSKLRVVDTHVADALSAAVEPTDYYAALDDLRQVSARQADVIELRVFGLSNDEIASDLNVSVATVKRDVTQARAFLAFQLGLPSNWIAPEGGSTPAGV